MANDSPASPGARSRTSRPWRGSAGVSSEPSSDADKLSWFERRGDVTIIDNRRVQIQLSVGGDNIQGDDNTIATGGSQIATSGGQVATGGGVASGRDTTHVTTTGGADAREGGTAATGASAVAREGSGAAAGGSQASVGMFDRAKKSRGFQACFGLALLLAIITTVLVIVGAFRLDWGGYIIAVIFGVASLVPLARGG